MEPSVMERLEPLVRRLELLLSQKPHVTLALEGPAAAGKSSAAEWLAQKLGGRVIHMDDFFLPLPLRTPERFGEPGGNVHYERFAAEVLPQLRAGGPVEYRAFDCGTMSMGSLRRLPPAPLTVVEGVYSCHPAFGSPWDLTAFLTVESPLQQQRILARDGTAMLTRYTEQWIPLENAYFAACRIPEQADLIL